MDKYPPLSVLVKWREENKTPEWIHDRCLEYAGYNRVSDIVVSNRVCEVCGNEPHLARGMGKKCYGKWYYREKVKNAS